MAKKTELAYFLPKTMVRLQARMRQLVDELDAARNTCEASDWVAELVTVADPARARAVSITSSWLLDYGIKLGFTEDGRLASADVESTGQVGSIVASAAGLAVGVASAAIFRFPVLPVDLTQTKSAGQGESDFAPVEDPEEQPDAAAVRYAAECPGDARRLKALRAEYRSVVATVAQARVEYRESNGVKRDDAWSHYRHSVRMAADVASELDGARGLFDAWRRSKQKTTEFVEAAFVPVSALPVLTEPQGTWELDWGEDEISLKVQRFFEAVGWVLALGDPRDWESEPAGVVVGGRPADARLHVLRPRPVGLVAVRRDPSGHLYLVEYRRELITDERCREVEVPLRKSWFAKRRTAVELSASGALTGLELGGASSAQGVAGMASNMGANAVAALESAGKTRTVLGALAAADQEETLARLNREVAIREQELAVGHDR